MADQDQPGQVVNPDQPFHFSTTVTAPADQPQPPPAGLPKNFNLLDLGQQQNYLEEPDQLPSDLPQRVGRAGLTALPYAAAAGAGFLTAGLADYFAVPWYYMLAGRPLAAGLGGAAGEYGKQEAYKRNIFDTGAFAPTSGQEERERVLNMGIEQGLTEIPAGLISLPGELKAARAAAGGADYLPGKGWYNRAVGKVAPTAAETTPILRTGMKYGIQPTEEGAAKAVKWAENFNSQIDKEIATKPSWFSAREYTAEIKARFDKLRQAAGATGTKSAENLKVVDDAERDFLINHGKVPIKRVPVVQKGKVVGWKALDRWQEPVDDLRLRARPISAARMQELKKGTWAEVRRKTNPRGGQTVLGITNYTNPGFELDALEELGRAKRALLGRRYPGIHAINESEGHMFEIERAIQRKLEKEGRRAVLSPETIQRMWYGASAGTGAGTLAGGSAGGVIGGAAGAAIPLAAEVARNPYVQAKTGTLINRLAQPGFARAAARGVVPGVLRGGEYLTEQPPEAIQEIDPSELGQLGGISPQVAAAYGMGGAAQRPQLQTRKEEEAPPPRAAYEPPVEQVRPQDRPIYELERAMKPEDRPLYNWRPEWASELAGAAGPGLTLSLLHTVAAMEASGRAAEQQKVAPNLVRSSAGAVGLMQVMPDMHGFTREELEDPRINIQAAAQYLKYLNSKYRLKPELVLAAYNAGEQALKDAGYKIYNMTQQTQTYVGKGLRLWYQLALSPDQAAQLIAEIPERLK